MSNLWCSELLDESPSTSRHSLGTYGSNNPSSSGWVSAERRRLHGMSLMDNSSTVHHPSRPLQNSASFRRVQTGVLAQSRRSLEFSIDNRNSNENRPSQYYNMSASTNDVTNSGSWRKNSTRVLTSIDTNARTFNAAQPVYQADSSSSGISHSLSLQRSAARKRRLTADHQLNVAQRLWVASDVDKTVHLDSRTLTALLRAEQYTLPNADHYKSLQREINENVRRSAVVFISDICNRENADLVVLPLAVSYIDRVLSVQFVPRHNLLALANACLLLASKMKAPRPLTPQQIVEHTDNWVTQDELLDWELFIVNKLGWQLSTATAYEFFDQLMVRAPILETLRESFAQTLAAMLKDLKLAALSPSQQAAACLLYVAGESKRRHLITESEAIINRCLRIEAGAIRSLYSTDIKFALGNWFFDDDSESSPVGNGPPAGKKNKKSASGPSTSRQAILDEHLLVDEICGEENFVIVTDDSPMIGGAGAATPRLLNQQCQTVRKVHESDQFFTSPAASRPKRTSSPPSLIKFSNDDETDYVNSPEKTTYLHAGTTSLYCEEQFTSDSMAILAPVPPPLADNLPLSMLPSVTLTTTHGSATHSNEGDDSGFNSIVSTPEMSQTTTTIVSTAPTSSIIYCNAPLGSMASAAGWPQGHQGLGQLWEQF